MIYRDSIFGKVIISDPLAIKIIKNPEFQRLKNIMCQGVPKKYYCNRVFPRYEHSVGVYLILKKLNADYKEQIAGLLHDISHKAFSHVYDWVIKDYTQKGVSEDVQDQMHTVFFETSSIKNLLVDHGLDPKEIFDLNRFKLLDHDIPFLCADRIEYSIRSLTPAFAKKVLGQIKIKNGRIVCTDFKIAREYAYKFLSLQDNEWGLPEAVIRYYHFSEILKLALKNNVLTLKDFDLDDKTLIQKLIDSKLSVLTTKLNVLETTKMILKNDSPNKKLVYKKFRHIDPEILNPKSNMVCRLSSIDSKFKSVLESSRVYNEEGIEFNPLW